MASNYFNMAHIYFEEQKYNLAIEMYKKALTLDASLRPAIVNIASCYAMLDETDKAIKYWLKSLEYDKSNPEIYFNLALSYAEDKNDPQKALMYARSAYDLGRKNPDILAKYGAILIKTGELYLAKEKLEYALKINPNHVMAKITLAETYIEMDKPNEAVDILEKIKDQEKDEKEYLYIKFLAYSKIYEETKNQEEKDKLKVIIDEICDKIQVNFGENPFEETGDIFEEEK